MTLTPGTRSTVAGVLLANATPHLASALAGRQHLTPLAGRSSSPVVNAAWAAVNVAGAGALLRGLPSAPRWDRTLWWLELGALAWTAWMAGSERMLGTNTTS